MTIIQAIILGIVQGLTEFLPVSSSGHLVIFEHLLGASLENINFDVFVHSGTLLSVLVYYRIELISLIKRFIFPGKNRDESRGEDEVPKSWILFIIIGTIPAVIIGLLFEDYITSAFKNIKLVGGVLIFCGLVLISTKWAPRRNNEISLVDAILIGLAQALAITPGISRSGMTISMGLFRKINPVKAADFSFLLSIPAVAGATILKLREVISSAPPTDQILAYFVGGSAAFIVGYLSILWLLSIVKKGKFAYFGIYCCVAGTIALLFIN